MDPLSGWRFDLPSLEQGRGRLYNVLFKDNNFVFSSCPFVFRAYKRMASQVAYRIRELKTGTSSFDENFMNIAIIHST